MEEASPGGAYVKPRQVSTIACRSVTHCLKKLLRIRLRLELMKSSLNLIKRNTGYGSFQCSLVARTLMCRPLKWSSSLTYTVMYSE